MPLAKTIVIKPTLNCNLRCKYCYEFQHNGPFYLKQNMDVKNLNRIVIRLATIFPKSKILWMFHGGEPLLNKCEYFDNFAECLQKVNNKYGTDFRIALQTNATLLSEMWLHTLEKHMNLLSERIVSVSIDGPQEINDAVRVSLNGEPSFQTIMDSISCIKKSKITFTTLTVIGQHNLSHPKKVYEFIKNLKPYFSKFIPCYNYNKVGAPENQGISPIQYANFMCEIFDSWVKDLPNLDKDIPFVIDPIITLVSKIIEKPVTWCEFRKEKCDNFTCIYPNGEMWLCDTFHHETTREYAYLGNIFELDDINLKKAIKTPTQVCKYEKFYDQIMSKCNNCDMHKYCGGGCLPLRNDMYNISKELFSEYCTGRRILIEHIKAGVSLAVSKS